MNNWLQRDITICGLHLLNLFYHVREDGERFITYCMHQTQASRTLRSMGGCETDSENLLDVIEETSHTHTLHHTISQGVYLWKGCV